MAKEKKKGGFIADFKAFISRGNVVDMAVGVVVGGAFGKIVTGLVNFIINPCISLLTGGVDLDSVKTVLKEADAVAETAEVAILWGSWIQTIIDFLIVALCIFIVIRAIAKGREKLNAKAAAEKAAADAAAKAKADEEAAAAAAAKAEADAKAAAVQDAIIEIRDLMKKN